MLVYPIPAYQRYNIVNSTYPDFQGLHNVCRVLLKVLNLAQDVKVYQAKGAERPLRPEVAVQRLGTSEGGLLNQVVAELLRRGNGSGKGWATEKEK